MEQRGELKGQPRERQLGEQGATALGGSGEDRK